MFVADLHIFGGDDHVEWHRVAIEEFAHDGGTFIAIAWEREAVWFSVACTLCCGDLATPWCAIFGHDVDDREPFALVFLVERFERLGLCTTRGAPDSVDGELDDFDVFIFVKIGEVDLVDAIASFECDGDHHITDVDPVWFCGVCRCRGVIRGDRAIMMVISVIFE